MTGVNSSGRRWWYYHKKLPQLVIMTLILVHLISIEATINTPSNNEQRAQQYMQTYLNNIQNLQLQYGTDIIKVQDVTEVYPILSTSYVNDDSNMIDCPFDYIPIERRDSQPQTQQQNNNRMPCYTPIITIFDAISNMNHQSSFNTEEELSGHTIQSESIPEVLLISGLDYTIDSMDLLAPSGIYSTLRLLLDCAVCESLSPWVVNNGTAVTTNDVDHDGITGNTNKEKLTKFFVGGERKLDDNQRPPQQQQQTDRAIECRQRLATQGITNEKRKWLARLATTRKIVAIPIVDVAGFYQRLVIELDKENDNDENRHLNNNNGKPNQKKNQQKNQKQTNQKKNQRQYASRGAECNFPLPAHYFEDYSQMNAFTTYPAQIINEVMRSNSFTLGISYHGTQQNIDISPLIEVPSWTSPDIDQTIDEQAMVDISYALSQFAGLNKNLPYEVRTSHTPLGDDKGCSGVIFEHFAFSQGSNRGTPGESIWMTQRACDNHRGNKTEDECSYPSEQTQVYDSSSLRAFIARVVSPPPNDFIIEDIPGFYNPSSDYSYWNGYEYTVHSDNDILPPQLFNNVRMALLTTELVEPYTIIRSVGGVELKDDDIIPLNPRPPGQCHKTRSMIIPESSSLQNTTVTWTVGGSLSVTETAIMFGMWNVLDKKIFDCVTQPTKQELDAFFTILRDFEVMEGEDAETMNEEASFTPVQSGNTRWAHHDHSHIDSDELFDIPQETIFSVTLDLSHYKVGDIIDIYSLARTDQTWSDESENGSSFTSQSNLVNARTESGRLDWFSVPVSIEIGPRPGFFESNDPIETSVRISDQGYEAIVESDINMIAYSLFMALIVVAITVFCAFCREERDGTDVCSVWRERRQINKQRIKMDDFFANESLELTSMTTLS